MTDLRSTSQKVYPAVVGFMRHHCENGVIFEREVTLEVEDHVLTVDSRWGGSQIPCAGSGEIKATLKAKAFYSLVTSRFREKAPTGPMKLTFRPKLKEVAVDVAGVKAKF